MLNLADEFTVEIGEDGCNKTEVNMQNKVIKVTSWNRGGTRMALVTLISLITELMK